MSFCQLLIFSWLKNEAIFVYLKEKATDIATSGTQNNWKINFGVYGT